MILTVLIIIIANVLISLKGFNDTTFFERYKFQVGPILRGQKDRMLSSGFLHADYMHLLFNMYALYLFAENVTHLLGQTSFLLIYFVSLIAGNFLSLLYHKKEAYYSAVGASGAVAGIVYAAILLHPDMTLIMFPLPIPLPGYVFGIGYLIYSIYGMKQQLGNIGHTAHLGGAIAGLILTLILKPSIVFNEPYIVLALAAVVIGFFIYEKKLK